MQPPMNELFSHMAYRHNRLPCLPTQISTSDATSVQFLFISILVSETFERASYQERDGGGHFGSG